MANPYKGLTVEIDGNATDFSRALRNARKEAEGTSKTLQTLQRALKVDPSNAKLLALQQEAYQKKLKSTRDQLDLLKKKEEEVKAAGGKDTIGETAWAQLQSDIARATKNVEQYEKTLRDLKYAQPVAEARQEIKLATEEVGRLNKALKLDPTNTDLLAQKQEALQKAIQASTKEVETFKTKQQDLYLSGVSQTSEEWITVQTQIKDAELKAQGFEQELKDITTTAQGMGGEVGSKIQKVGDKIQEVGGKISGFGDKYTKAVSVPIVGAAAASIKAATDIDTSLTDVRKTVDATEEEYQALKEAAIDYSKTNAVDASTILSLQALGAQLGFSKDELKKFAEVASGLDIATNMDAETAATEMAHFANIVGMSHDEIDKYASTIVALGNNTATTEADISALAQRLAGAGKSIGMSTPEILGMSAALSSLGIEAEAGGSALSTIMSNVDMTVAKGTAGVQQYADAVGMTTDEFIRALNEDEGRFEEFAKNNGTTVKQLKSEVLDGVDTLSVWAEAAGMSSEEFAAKWREKPVEAFQDLLKGIQTSTDEGGNLSLILDNLGITAIRQSDSMRRLVNSGNLLVDTVNIANEGWEKNVALTNEVENRNKSLASKFEILKNRVTAVADDVGEELADALLEALDAAEPLFKQIEDGAQAFSEMDDETQRMIIEAVGAVAALGPLLSIAGRITSTAGGAVKALGSIGSVLGSFGKTGKAATTAIEGTSKAMGAATTMASGLKGGLIGLGVAAAAVAAALIIKAWQDYQHELELTAKGAKSLSDMETEAEGKLNAYGSTLQETTRKTNELREAQAKSNDEFVNSLSSFGTDNRMVQTYLDTMIELSGRTGLTREEQEKLTLAVKGYNDLTGGNIEIIDKENGKLSESTDALIANRDAWIKNQKVKIYEDKYTEALRESIEAEEELEKATQHRVDAQKRVDQLTAEMAKYPELYESYSFQIDMANRELEEAKRDEENLIAVRDNAKSQMGDIEKKISDVNTEYDKQTSALNNTKAALGQYSEQAIKRLEATGISVDDLAGKLVNQGVTADDLAKISEDDFYAIYMACQGNLDEMKRRIDEYNQKKLEEKLVEFKTLGYDEALNAIRSLNDMDIREKELLIRARMKNELGYDFVGPVIATNAAGGIFRTKNILDSIPKHADGGIVNRPTLTKVGWVGESGAEAILPLTNGRYVAPLAKTIAKYMPESKGDTYLVIDGATVNADAQIKQAFLDLFTEIARKGDMNRGHN